MQDNFWFLSWVFLIIHGLHPKWLKRQQFWIIFGRYLIWRLQTSNQNGRRGQRYPAACKKKRELQIRGGKSIELGQEYGVCPDRGQGIFPPEYRKPETLGGLDTIQKSCGMSFAICTSDETAVVGNLAYLEERENQTQYPQFQADRLTVVSSKAANKLVVEARLKWAGMHWARENVNPMLARKWLPN